MKVLAQKKEPGRSFNRPGFNPPWDFLMCNIKLQSRLSAQRDDGLWQNWRSFPVLTIAGIIYNFLDLKSYISWFRCGDFSDYSSKSRRCDAVERLRCRK
jgi:hypothetical protein